MFRRIISLFATVLMCVLGLAIILGLFMVIVDIQILNPIFTFFNQLEQILIPAHSIFLAILAESFPFVFIGAVLSSCVHEFIHEEQFARWIPKNKLSSVAIGGLIGFILPVCDCGTNPVARNLLSKGVSRAAVVAFTLAAPVINPISMLATYFAFGMNVHMMLLRVFTTFLIACVVGFIVGRVRDATDPFIIFPSRSEVSATVLSQTKKSKLQKLRSIMEHSVEEIFGIIGFLICSAAVSSLYQVYHTQHAHLLQLHSGVLAVIMMMLLAILFSLCSSADAFVARSFAASYSPGAVLAFLVIGQMADLRNIFLIPRTFGLKTGIKILVLCILFCLLAGTIL